MDGRGDFDRNCLLTSKKSYPYQLCSFKHLWACIPDCEMPMNKKAFSSGVKMHSYLLLKFCLLDLDWLYSAVLRDRWATTKDLSEWYCAKSVLALVDGELWDMYKPLTKSCSIQFLTFKDEDPEEVNKAYWRSCAAILGHALEQAFKDDYTVTLVRAPEVPVISGAFCYDVVLDGRLDDWNPTTENLHSFTKDALQLISKDLPFECLEVEEKVGREIFQYNPYKLLMLEEKAAQHPKGKVTIHRFGDFVDLSEGPHIPRTGFCLQYEVTAHHPLSTISSEYVRRFQGLSLPRHLMAHHTVWNKLRTRAQKPVTERQNQEPETDAAV
ncbi:large ribosomal subunit protein mL39 [Anomaloglossus baeobatrachus]|uniref:large ribosomal subunit protein mL39 n=1 Tax=Anomaloglossus baeobatrachus TaxID=238106 RepID=UPI003F501EA3